VDEHDSIMGKIQVAHHFLYLMLASYLSNNEIPPAFFTRSFQKTLDNFKGIEKNLNAIIEIQEHNPHADATRKEFISLMEQFISFEPQSKLEELLKKIAIFKHIYLIKKE
jgi:prephenate dehydrogenase